MAASNHTRVQAHNADGHQLDVQHTTTDSPILPAANLRELKDIDPGLVPWVINQTELESKHRRYEESRVNLFILFERMSGIIAGTLVAVFGLSLGAYLVMHDHDVAGVGISGVGLASIVSVLVARQRSRSPQPSQNPQPKRMRQAKKLPN